MIKYSDKRDIKTILVDKNLMAFDTERTMIKSFRIFGWEVWHREFTINGEILVADTKKRSIGLRQEE